MMAIRISGLTPLFLVGLGLLVGPIELEAQEPTEGAVAPLVARGEPNLAYDHERDAPLATAVRVEEAPSIDGRPDEDVWMTAQPITNFTQTVPNEGDPITERTEVRFLYDDNNIYLGAWLWDRGEILSRLARRDAGVPDADFFVVLFDSYHDHRTAYRFATSPAAMKRDEIVSGGGSRGSFGDTSWDPIWDVQTSITDEGWFIEMRIPFSQLRYSSADVQTWGLQVERKIRRHGEDTVWAFTSRDEPGGVPRYGHLVGIQGIAQGKRLELLPYLGARAEYAEIPRDADASFDNPFRSGSDYFGNMGMDLKYRLTSNLTLDATVNPDFGQVEVDPAVINLSAYETRYDEKRPFFVEGGEIFDFGSGRGGAQLLYSRRIGRAPQGSAPDDAVYSEDPGATTILGALKLTSKTASGWSTGLLNAVTGKEMAAYVDEAGARDEAVVEPLTNYFAGRVRRDFNEGAGSFGLIATAVNRNLGGSGLEDDLRSAGYSAGMDWGLDILNREWSVGGEVAGSYIRGSAEAISETQLSSARYLDRPDADHLEYDPTATSLSGLSGRLGVSKEAGDWRGGASVNATTPSFEVNDLGFQSNADRIHVGGDYGYTENDPGEVLRDWHVGFGSGADWNFGGDRQALDINFNASASLLSFHGFNARVSRQFESYDDRLTRGGPEAIAPAGWSAGFGINTNSRKPIQVRTNFNFSGDEAGGSSRSVGFDINFRFNGIYELQMGPNWRRNHNAAQYVTSVTDPAAVRTFGRRYVFAPLDQTTVSFETRFNATFTPGLSFELYAQPLLSSGDYGDFMELVAPRTFDFQPYAGDSEVSNRDFNVRSLIGNAVLRWEWRPGSTIYLVWQQARSERLRHVVGDTEALRVGQFDLDRDVRGLFGIHPSNILLLKVNYWLNP